MVMAHLGPEAESRSQRDGACRESKGQGAGQPDGPSLCGPGGSRPGSAGGPSAALEWRPGWILTPAAVDLSFSIVMSMEAAVRAGARVRRGPSARRAEPRDQA